MIIRHGRKWYVNSANACRNSDHPRGLRSSRTWCGAVTFFSKSSMWDPGTALPLNTNSPDSFQALSPLALDILSNMYRLFFMLLTGTFFRTSSTTSSETSSFSAEVLGRTSLCPASEFVNERVKTRSRDPLVLRSLKTSLGCLSKVWLFHVDLNRSWVKYFLWPYPGYSLRPVECSREGFRILTFPVVLGNKIHLLWVLHVHPCLDAIKLEINGTATLRRGRRKPPFWLKTRFLAVIPIFLLARNLISDFLLLSFWYCCRLIGIVP